MPAFAFLEKAPADANTIEAKMRALRTVGVPYTDEEIAGAKKQLEGKSELDALIAYLQGMGLEMKNAKYAYGHQRPAIHRYHRLLSDLPRGGLVGVRCEEQQKAL
jgi:cbb3-type cytochrome oxidase cytochrome c subunit